MIVLSNAVGNDPLEEMEQSSQSAKESEMQYVGAISKMTEFLVCFQGKSFNNTVIQLYVTTTNAEEAKVERFYPKWVSPAVSRV